MDIKKTSPKKWIYFNYFREIEPWLIDKYPKNEQYIKTILAEEIEGIFSDIGLVGYNGDGFVTVNLNIFEDNFLGEKRVKEIIKDLKNLNNNNSDITFYIDL